MTFQVYSSGCCYLGCCSFQLSFLHFAPAPPDFLSSNSQDHPQAAFTPLIPFTQTAEPIQLLLRSTAWFCPLRILQTSQCKPEVPSPKPSKDIFLSAKQERIYQAFLSCQSPFPVSLNCKPFRDLMNCFKHIRMVDVNTNQVTAREIYMEHSAAFRPQKHAKNSHGIYPRPARTFFMKQV